MAAEPNNSPKTLLTQTRKQLAYAMRFVRPVLDWIGGHEVNVLVALFLLCVAVWGFIELADEVNSGDTARFDEWAIRALRDPNDPATPIGPRWLAELGRDMTALGGIGFVTLLTITVAGFLWLKRLYGAMWLVVLAAISGVAVNMTLKNLFDRPRPDLVPHLSHVYTSSFPSGHSMLSATVFLTLGALLGRFVDSQLLKAYFLIVAVVLTLLVGVSRVYMGVHYPTDVLAGWAAGLAWAVVCWLAARFLQRRGAVAQNLEDSNPTTANRAAE
jgi:undecaprenyl-diphosphatase